MTIEDAFDEKLTKPEGYSVAYKYQVGDEVYFMSDNRVCKGKIVHIEIQIGEKSSVVRYRVFVRQYKPGVREPYDRNVLLSEPDVYPNKQELLNSL